MIAYLKGKVILKTEKYIILNVEQIGYQVQLTEKNLNQISEEQEVELYTHLYIREDAQELYGFLSLPELEMFKNLISISGVGPKSALSTLASASVTDIASAVLSEDPTLLKKVSGIGQKTAERIVLELKSKIESISAKGNLEQIQAAPRDWEIVEALGNLGYKNREILDALKMIPKDSENLSERLKQVLKILGR